MLIRRSQSETFLPGMYELPGGKVVFGETPRNALVREFREETQIDINVVEPIREFSYTSDNGWRHTVELVFRVAVLQVD